MKEINWMAHTTFVMYQKMNVIRRKCAEYQLDDLADRVICVRDAFHGRVEAVTKKGDTVESLTGWVNHINRVIDEVNGNGTFCERSPPIVFSKLVRFEEFKE